MVACGWPTRDGSKEPCRHRTKNASNSLQQAFNMEMILIGDDAACIHTAASYTLSLALQPPYALPSHSPPLRLYRMNEPSIHSMNTMFRVHIPSPQPSNTHKSIAHQLKTAMCYYYHIHQIQIQLPHLPPPPFPPLSIQNGFNIHPVNTIFRHRDINNSPA